MHRGAGIASFKFFLISVIECPKQRGLGKTGFVLAYGPRGRESNMEGKYGCRQGKHDSSERKLLGHSFMHM